MCSTDCCPTPTVCCQPRNLPPKERLLICPPYDYSSDDCPPIVRRSSEFDPHNPPEARYKPDPRPRLPCNTSGCCACRPPPLRKKPNVPNLKLRQLADCYNCRVSNECHNRRKVFYRRWQTHLDNIPKRYPNTDYSTYCCDDYVDLSLNNDFLRYDNHRDLRLGPRTEALKNFLWLKNLSRTNYDYKAPMYECAPHEPYLFYTPPMMRDPLGKVMEKRYRLTHEDGITLWKDLISRPEYENFIETATPFRDVNKPFRKDTSFTNPAPIFASNCFSMGNDPPFKEFRELKKYLG